MLKCSPLLKSKALTAGLVIGTFLGPSSVVAEEASESQAEGSPMSFLLKLEGKETRFPDFGYMPAPEEYHGRVFSLSQSYPATLPRKDPAARDILSIDFKKNWEQYALAVRSYILEGNVNGDDYEDHFYLEDNTERDWYHVPWQHWGDTGREGVHGLTKEGPVGPGMLAPEHTTKSHAYAVGFYNNLGGYTIGRVWDNPDFPNLRYMADNDFPEGTVVGKVLFVPLDEEEVPYLQNPIEWQAYIRCNDIPAKDQASCQKGDTSGSGAPARQLTRVRLIQMDFMVRDSRSKETGWTFGTFVYNGSLGHENRWENLVPLGVMWGNDPDINVGYQNPTPTETIINPNLWETIINAGPEIPPSHLGWGGRLNGPVDNALSSCVSCHSTAQYPTVSNILPQFNRPKVPVPNDGEPASEAWMRWYRNIQAGQPFDEGKAISMDYSLQLTKSIKNFMDAKAQIEKSWYTVEYWGKGHEVRRNIND